MKALILAGGLGSRLKKRVPDLPKPMAPVAGRPFLEYILDQLCQSDITEVIMSVGYKADSIRSHFGARYRGLNLSYCEEERPLGTGGAIARALSSQESETFLVLNGDTFIDISFQKLIDYSGGLTSPVTMVLKEMEDVSRYGTVDVENDVVVRFVEKGNRGRGLINAGVYLLNSGVFSEFTLPEAFSLEHDLLQPNIKMLQPHAHITDAWFIDIGVPSDFDRAQEELPDIVGSIQ